MSAKILIVDDIVFNLKLLESKLKQAYFDVFTASNGVEAIRKTQEINPDLILMDVMMPDIDGIEATKRIKSIAELAHIPIVIITALNSQEDKISALMAGADDFITKPINDDILMIRMKSLLRMKFAADELRLREKSSLQLGIATTMEGDYSVLGSGVMLVDDDHERSKRIQSKLIENGINVDVVIEPDKALPRALKHRNYSLIIVSTQLLGVDGLRLCSQLKSNESLRNIPIIIMVDANNVTAIERGLDMGVQDYVIAPIDLNELVARASNQIIRKQHLDKIRDNYLSSLSLSLLDPLTNLHNRRFLDTHLSKLMKQSTEYNKDLTILIFDIDNFKQINDTYGHAAGDIILQELSSCLLLNLRVSDLCVRYGGDEFIVVLPNTDAYNGQITAEKILQLLRKRVFFISKTKSISCFCSIGIAQAHSGDSIEDLIKRADANLYKAKNLGRNQAFFCPITKEIYSEETC